MTECNIFNSYWNEVASLINGNPKSVRLAQSLSEYPLSKFDGSNVVRRLYESLACEGWWNNTYGSNWIWRSEVLPNSTRKREVALEREIVKVGTITSLPFSSNNDLTATSSAAEPLHTAIPCSLPIYEENSFSNLLT